MSGNAGALVGDQVQSESAVVKADGTVQLPAASAIFGTGSASALSVWSLTDSSANLKQGGQVCSRCDRHCMNMAYMTAPAGL